MSDTENTETETEVQVETAKGQPKILKVEDGKATVEAANGRIIVVSKVNAVDYFRLTRAMGASSANPAMMDLATLAASVKQIDQHLLPRPVREADIEHTIGMLNFDGLAAVGEGLKRLSEQAQDGADAAKN